MIFKSMKLKCSTEWVNLFSDNGINNGTVNLFWAHLKPTYNTHQNNVPYHSTHHITCLLYMIVERGTLLFYANRSSCPPWFEVVLKQLSNQPFITSQQKCPHLIMIPESYIRTYIPMSNGCFPCYLTRHREQEPESRLLKYTFSSTCYVLP